MSFEANAECARRLDAADPLAAFRERFELPRTAGGAPQLYLCGHSLGPLPRSARRLVEEELDDWARLAVAGHHAARRPWIDYHGFLEQGLAQLAGAAAHEVVAMSSLTVNLHLMMASFYRPQGVRRRILIEAGAFPSDRYAVVSQIAWHGLDPAQCLLELAPRAGESLLREEDLEALLEREGKTVALVLWPGVQFRTGQAFDPGRIARAAHRAGALAGFDLAHAIGNVPLALHAAGADFAVWCSYKYLNGGPGAIGGLFVHERHGQGGARPRLAGWWGHEAASRFAMQPGFRPAPGAHGWAVSNPPVLAAAPLIASLAIFAEAGLERLRAKSLALGAYLEFLLGARAVRGVEIVTPRAPQARGCQLSLRIADGAARGRRIFERLLAAGIVGDWREPDILRVAPAPLYNGFEEVYAFVDRLAVLAQETPA